MMAHHFSEPIVLYKLLQCLELVRLIHKYSCYVQLKAFPRDNLQKWKLHICKR